MNGSPPVGTDSPGGLCENKVIKRDTHIISKFKNKTKPHTKYCIHHMYTLEYSKAQ